ncbi:MAG: TfoX/Sxy family protein [bacterium]
MSTSPSFISYIHYALGGDTRAHTRAMFGEYALYYDDRVVALICDEVVYLKITPGTTALLGTDHESGPPYPGAKPHYIISEKLIQDRVQFTKLLTACAHDVPAKKKK